MDRQPAPKRPSRRSDSRRAPPPLTAARLEDLALAYVARFATSAGKLSTYLARKLRERGWAEADGVVPDIDRVVARFVALGYVDDAGYAQGKARGMLRRGLGVWRIDQALGHDGIAENVRADVRGSEHERRVAALTLARRRRLGPFGVDHDGRLDPATREKQVGAFLRAGHPLAYARALVDAGSIAIAQEWADEELD